MFGPIEKAWTDDGAAASLLRLFLRPLSWAFRALVVLRAGLYANGWLSAAKIGVPVVSVGNLRVGGSGKTPFVILLVRMFQKRGLRPVVVSRGYGAASNTPRVVATAETLMRIAPNARVAADWIDAAKAARTPGNCGAADEALLVALRTGAAVVTDADRVAGARLAAGPLGADVIVLDDGFQHLRLARTFDVVLVSASDRCAACLPSGPLREPWSALRRANFLAWSDSEAAPHEPVCTNASAICLTPTALVVSVDAVGGAEPTWLAGKTVVTVAGIARPRRFDRSVESAGARIRRALRYPDHHRYEISDALAISAAATGCDAVVTTEKDLIKLAAIWTGEVPLLALRIDLTIKDSDALVTALAGSDERLDARGHESHHPGSALDRGEEVSRKT